jgi:hypothetical protein
VYCVPKEGLHYFVFLHPFMVIKPSLFFWHPKTTEPSRPPRRRQATRAERPRLPGSPPPPPPGFWPPFLLVAGLKPVAGGGGPSFGRLSPQSSSPSRSRVCSPPMLGGGVRFCRWSVTPLRLCFPGGVGDAEAKALQRNNFSQLLLFSDGDLLRRQQ